MKKIVVGIFLILLMGLVIINNNGEKILLSAKSYGVEYNKGRIFDPIERHELKQLVEQTSVENYNQATDLINEMIASGYNEADIPLVLYSGVTANELNLITELHANFMASLPEGETKVANEVKPEEDSEDTINNDSDNDGVGDEFDICDGGNDLVDDNYNLVPDECESTSGESTSTDVTSDDYTDSDTSSNSDQAPPTNTPEEPTEKPEEPVDTPEEPIDTPEEPTDTPDEGGETDPGDGETPEDPVAIQPLI